MTASVLVTGASGFIGRAVASHLAKEGRRVRGSTRAPVIQPISGLHWLQTALEPDADWTDALEGVDVVVHAAACLPARTETPDDVALLRRVNVEGTVRLAKQAAQLGVRRFVFISSVKVLGESTPSGQRLAPGDPTHPQDAYAHSKVEAERVLFELCARTNMEVVVIRPPLVYGPGVRGNFAALVRWVRAGIPLPFGAVSNRRSLVALDNLVNLIALCADPVHSAAAGNQVFLVSDGEDVSTSDLVRKIASAYQTKANLVAVPPTLIRTAATMFGQRAAADRLFGSLQVDHEKCQRLLGWQPVISMDMQLHRMAVHDAVL